LWPSCLIGSIGLAVAGVATAPNAGAVSTPTYTYSSSVTAIGLQTAIFSNPEPSSVPDLTDVQTPSSNALLNSFGTSDSSAHIGNLNGLGQLPSLICLASAAACNAIPIGTLTAGLIKSFPPPDPLDAHATYPAKQHATAPSVGPKKATVKVHSGPLRIGAANSDATATLTSTSTNAVAGNLSVLGAISIGSVRTSTSQTVNSSGLLTTAVADLSNINIGSGHLLHIGSVRSTLKVYSSPGKAATDTASSRIGDVKVLGRSATIDGKGVHVKGLPGVPKFVTAAYQKVLDKVFSGAGFGIKQAAIHRSDGHAGHTVSVAGLELFFKHRVKGTPPITIGLPGGIPCPIEPITGKLPVDPCAGVGLSLNAKYRGQIALGQVGVVSLAQPGPPNSQPPPIPVDSPSTGTSGGNPGGGPIGGGPSTGGGGVPGGTTTVSSGTSPGSPPTVATQTQSYLDPLKGLSGRLWWFFPLIAVSVLALVGRLRTPARLPSQ